MSDDIEPSEQSDVEANQPEEASTLTEVVSSEALTDSKGNPVQVEMPFAIVQGQPLTTPPKDLYIPPEALEIILEAFEGPLDLLLYLIKKQNLNILDIPISKITKQYMSYIEMMTELNLELAAEYLVMAAMLAEIKSRMLLPRIQDDEEDEDDPRAELIRRLQEYERYKKAAEEIDELPRLEREICTAVIDFPHKNQDRPLPEVSLEAILKAFGEVMKRTELSTHHYIKREPLSVRERMSLVLDIIVGDEFIEFSRLFVPEEGRAGIVVSLLAILELLKETLIEMVQNEAEGVIYLRAAA